MSFFWPALLGYSEAALAYSSARYTRLATWGVRIGWLAQTGLLISQAAHADGFPWATWAGSLNLFVWFIVGTYLIWGCRDRYRLLGLTVMPVAVILFVIARVGGGTAAAHESGYSYLFLLIHVGCVLAAFAGFTLAAALAAIYLWEDRRLKRRASDILSMRMPPLATLERVIWRTIVVCLPLLTVALIAGFIRLREKGGGFDPLMAMTVMTWLLYAGFLVAHPKGRRAAFIALIGFVFVILVRLVLAGTHQ